jgi:hypothetical protein
VTCQHKWLCAGGPATRQHKGPFLLAQSCLRCLARQQKPVLADRTNRFWPGVCQTIKNVFLMFLLKIKDVDSSI